MITSRRILTFFLLPLFVSCKVGETPSSGGGGSSPLPEVFQVDNKTDVSSGSQAASLKTQFIDAGAKDFSIDSDFDAEYRICADVDCNTVLKNWGSSDSRRTVSTSDFLQLRMTAPNGIAQSRKATVTIDGESFDWYVRTKHNCAYSNNIRTGFYPAADESTTDLMIFLPGRNANPRSPQYRRFLREMAAANINVLALAMPWSNWNASLADAHNYVSCIKGIEKLEFSNIHLGGHSLGASAAAIYMKVKSPTDVDSLTMIAPGFWINDISDLKQTLTLSINKANSKVGLGQGSSTFTFDMLDNNGGTTEIQMTADDYLTFTDDFPDMDNIMPDVQTDVLWIVGTNDEEVVIDHRPYFFNLPNPNAQNSFESISGNHLGVMDNSSSKTIEFIK